MPRLSEKHKLIDNLKQRAIDDLIKLELFSTDYEEQLQKETEIIDDLIFSLTTAEHFRYAVPFVQRPKKCKNNNFLTNVLPNLKESQFKDLVRVNWSEFKAMLELIKEDDVFVGRRYSRQLPPAMQLMIVLYRLGVTGEAGSIHKISNLFDIGDGGTIYCITNRIFKAILNLEEKYLYWPAADERRQLVQETLYELPDCVGYLHCTNIKLAEPPLRNAHNYYVEAEQMYAVKMQVVCDHRLRIRHLVAGHPGSTDDNVIYNEYGLAKNPAEYFEGSQWLAGDSRYKLSATLITPHHIDDHDGNASEQLSEFNRTLSKYHVRVENCLALLRQRFGSLNELKISIRKDEAMKQTEEWIKVCVILHNILLSLQDVKPNPVAEEPLIDASAAFAGEIKRQKLMSLIGVLNE